MSGIVPTGSSSTEQTRSSAAVSSPVVGQPEQSLMIAIMKRVGLMQSTQRCSYEEALDKTHTLAQATNPSLAARIESIRTQLLKK